MMETVNELHNKIVEDLRLNQKLSKNNKGANLINIGKKESSQEKYFVKVLLEVDMNLKESSSKAVVKSNLPFVDWRYYHEEINPLDFLEHFKEWALTPIYFPKHINRKNRNFTSSRQVGSYGLPFKKKKGLSYNQIKITVYPEAKKYMENALLMTEDKFKDEIIKICSSIRYASDKEVKDFDRYIALREQIKDLKDMVQRNSNYGHGYDVDRTINLTISKKEYNTRQKKIEFELKKLTKKHTFLKIPEIEYIEILKEIPKKEWIKQNKDELKNEFETYEDEDESFKPFCNTAYKNWLEENFKG